MRAQGILTASIIITLFFFPVVQCGQNIAHAGGVDDYPHLREALTLLQKSAAESCSICAEKLKRQAIALLNRELYPGRIFKTDTHAIFVKHPGFADNEFVFNATSLAPLYVDATAKKPPLIVFRFLTASKSMVGISFDDRTDEGLAETYKKLPLNSAIAVNLKIIRYQYGDSESCIISSSESVVRVFCKIVRFGE